MDQQDHDGSNDRFVVKPTSDSHFSWLRTRLSVERTLMSWVRTAVSLIGFGFTIVQFFQHVSAMEGVDPAKLPHAPRYLGLSLIGVGVLALLISVWQYRRVNTYLNSGIFSPLAKLEGEAMHSPLYLVSIALIFIGLFAFSAVATRGI